MSIIGIIANERQTNQIKKQINKEKLNLEFVCINYKSIENVKNIKFEILIIQDPLEKLKEKQEYINKIIKSTKYVLLNSDINIKEENLRDIDLKMLTYGLKQKATITMSGIEKERAVISIQRAFKNLKEKVIEQQEVPVSLIGNSSRNLYNSLIKIAIIELKNDRNAQK